MWFNQITSIPFTEFVTNSSLGITPVDLPLMEGLVGFSALGVVLIGLSYLEKWGIASVNQNVIICGLTIGFVIGIFLVLFKSIVLVGL